MKKVLLLSAGLAFILLVFFGMAIAMDVPIFTNPRSIQGQGGWWSVLISSVLLISDILFPVPSSIIMITNGALFGIVNGCLVSLLGGVLASMTGWLLGKMNKKAVDKFIGPNGLREADSFIKKWGSLAIILSRPIPVLAETVAIVSGSLVVSPVKMTLYSIAGLLPACLLYAYSGSRAIEMNTAWQSFLFVIAIALTVWLVGKKLVKSNSTTSEKSYKAE